MASISQLKQWLDEHRSSVREDYFEFLRFKSISADPAFAPEMKRCANWLVQYIGKNTGMSSKEIETETYPIVYAEDLSKGPSAPTILVYGHYDVQPVDPL